MVIVGAGPAGASLAYLLARRGVDVTLLERRHTFDREFRGEILMPSGVDALAQMGLTPVLAGVPQRPLQDLSFYLNARPVFHEHLPADLFHGHPPLAVSQPALLEAVVSAADESPHFTFRSGVSVRALLRRGDRVSGVLVHDADGESEIPAALVVGADGRHSAVRRALALPARQMHQPMDIVWCKIPCPEGWPGVRAYAGRGHLLIAYRTWDDTLQLGWVILKGAFRKLRDSGVARWIEEMSNHVTADFAAHLARHQDAAQKPFLLEAVCDRVERWSAPGALLIGDAAHTMSPVGGQGLNVALRDVIVAANHLVPLLAGQDPTPDELDGALALIEHERLPEIEQVQAMQAQPPRLMLSRAWWGEPLRRLGAAALASPRLRARVAGSAATFAFGVTDVKLAV